VSIKPQHLLGLAQGLDASESEVHRRAACSRAYYASFHASLAFAQSHSYVPPKADAHESLIRFLISFSASGHEQRVVRQAGYAMRRMKDLRVRADYLLSVTFDSADSQETIGKAVGVLKRLGDLQPETTR
jgi:uncharacterized protein (UPF0332 family)